MKKLLAFCMATLLVGCSAAPSSSVSSSSVASDSSAAVSMPESSSNSDIESESNFGKVTITIPSSLTKKQVSGDFDGESFAAEAGYDSATLQEDGSITVVMSQKKHNELMADIRKQLEAQFGEFSNDPATPYIKEILCNKDFTEITMRVDRAGYEATFDVTSVGIAAGVGMYRVFSGENSSTHFQVVDEATQEVISEKDF